MLETTVSTTQWPDMLRVAGSLHTGTVAGYELLRMLGRDGNSTPLGAAFAECGRAAKTLHLLAMCDPDDETYRRTVHVQLTVQKSRHRPCRRRTFRNRRPARAGRPARRSIRTRRSRPSPSGWAVSRDRPHSTGVESASHTSSLNRLVWVPRARINQLRVPPSLRSRLLYPDCAGRYGNSCCRWARPNRNQRASLVKPRRACATANVTTSASVMRGVMPTAGRHGTRSGLAFNVIDLHVQCRDEGVQISVHAGLLLDVWGSTPILDTLALKSRQPLQSHQQQSLELLI